MKRKGQFYIITSLVFILAMFYARAGAVTNIEQPEFSTKYLFDNLKAEAPVAVNVIYANSTAKNSADVENNLRVFMNFAQNASSGHFQKLYALSMLMLPYGQDYNVSVGNFMRGSIGNVNVTIGSASCNASTLGDSSFARFTFTSVPEAAAVQVAYTYNGTSYSNSFNITNRRTNCYFELKSASEKVTWKDYVVC